jgi:hypothetical protein
MFQLCFRTHVASVFIWMLHMFHTYIASVFIWMQHIFAMVFKCCKSMIQVFQKHVSSVSEACFKYFICLLLYVASCRDYNTGV